MKNVLAGAVAATLLTSALLASPAIAADTPPGVVAVGIGKPAGQKSIVKAQVIQVSSDVVPEGELLLKVFRMEQTAEGRELVRAAVRRMDIDDRGKARFAVRFRQPGKYRFAVEYNRPEGQGGGYAVGFGKLRVTKK